MRVLFNSLRRSSSAGRPLKGAKIGDVDMETYKKMVVGQKAKPARSKTRKLSKSEEKDIRAAAGKLAILFHYDAYSRKPCNEGSKSTKKLSLTSSRMPLEGATLSIQGSQYQAF